MEEGYILNTTTLVTILDPHLTPITPAFQDPDFGTLDLSSKVPAGQNLVGVRWDWANNVPNAQSFIRGIDSTDTDSTNTYLGARSQTAATQMAALNNDREIEYVYGEVFGGPTNTADFAVLWYDLAIGSFPAGAQEILFEAELAPAVSFRSEVE